DSIEGQLEGNTKILFLCHPNNPTGSLLNKEKILQLCEKLEGKCILVIDEAYIEFSQDNGFTQYISQYTNLVILKTMSKAFGLAAARIGVMISNENLIGWIKKLLAPYPISKPAALEAINALSKKNINHISEQIKIIINERNKLESSLSNLNIINKIWLSEANFLLVEFTYNVMDLCLENGIVIRSMAKIIGCDKTCRITVGSPEENLRVLSVLKKLNELEKNEQN
ncbi:MAG: histidinol-phosphate aminotransferase, partial [Francisellaceae bacterium]